MDLYEPPSPVWLPIEPMVRPSSWMPRLQDALAGAGRGLRWLSVDPGVDETVAGVGAGVCGASPAVAYLRFGPESTVEDTAYALAAVVSEMQPHLGVFDLAGPGAGLAAALDEMLASRRHGWRPVDMNGQAFWFRSDMNGQAFWFRSADVTVEGRRP